MWTIITNLEWKIKFNKKYHLFNRKKNIFKQINERYEKFIK